MQKLKQFWFETMVSPKRIRLYATLSLITQILIVVTGGAVRLTASGLGCPTWPKCTDESLITTPEMGFHGIIEFGNRLLTFVLLIVAILTFLVAARMHSGSKKLFRPFLGFVGAVVVLVAGLATAATSNLSAGSIAILALAGILIIVTTIWFLSSARSTKREFVIPAFGLGFGIIAQAVLGGITVLLELNPWIVGAHFLLSAILIGIASLLLWRVRNPKNSELSRISSALRWPILISGFVTVVIGVLVTGAGPHAGDIDTPRNGLPLEIWQHYHSYPAYLMTGLIAISWLGQLRNESSIPKSPFFKVTTWLLVVSIAQAIVGVTQARLGVPALLVGIHMLGAAVGSFLLATQFIASKRK